VPPNAKAEEIKADLSNGVLRLTIPKTAEPKKEAKQIPVSGEGKSAQ
jgi:HSP20 family molecular chaperone IbpA